MSRKVKTPDYFCLSWKSSERDFIDDILGNFSLTSHLALAGWLEMAVGLWRPTEGGEERSVCYCYSQVMDLN